MITLIAALSKNNVIGKDGDIPWKISADMKRFAELTTGHTVVMGRKTYESLPKKFRPLPDRNNIVLTSQPNYQEGGGIEICQSTDILVDYLSIRAVFKDAMYPQIFIIGGASLYNFCIPFADKLELTFVDGEYEGDTFFPAFKRRGDTLTFQSDVLSGETFVDKKLSKMRFSLTNHEQHDGYSFQTFEQTLKLFESAYSA